MPSDPAKKQNTINASTIARMAGNIAPSLIALSIQADGCWDEAGIVTNAVGLARAIAAEVKRTKPEAGDAE